MKATIRIINQARKSLLLDNTGVWVKDDDNVLFDVKMGSFDCAEVCELVGLYLMGKISVPLIRMMLVDIGMTD